MLHWGSKVVTLIFMSDKIVKQGAKFGLVGISNAIIDYSLYIGLTTLLKVPLDKVFLVKYFSGSMAMINSFYWNRTWTFKSKAKLSRSAVRFLIATFVSVWGIQPGVVWLFTATKFGQAFGTFWFHMAQTIGIVGLLPQTFTLAFVIKTVAFGMGVATIMIWDFTLYKLWAFKED